MTAIKKHILCNKIQTPDGTVLVSRHKTDVAYHKDENGDIFKISGGTIKTNRQCSSPHYTDLSVYHDDDISVIREHMEWADDVVVNGLRVKYSKLKDIPSTQIKKELLSGHPDYIHDIFEKELEVRE